MALPSGGASGLPTNLIPPAGGSISSGYSTSTSTPVPYQGPEGDLLREFAQYSRSLAPQMLGWAQNAYARGDALSDDLLNQANIYASPGRIAQEMGQAQAHVQQGADAARQASIRDLEKYGVDPSSGRYAALDMAERNKAAAAAAGAGNVQRNATEATGRELRRDAFAAKNANNIFGARAMALPNEYLKTAMSLKYPPMGQQSESYSQQQSASQQPGRGASATSQPPSGSGRGGGGGPPGFPSGGMGSMGSGTGGRPAAALDPYGGHVDSLPRSSGGNGGAQIINVGDDGYGGYSVDSGYYDPQGYAQDSFGLDPANQFYNPYSAYDDGGQTWGTQDYTTPYDGWDQQYLAGGDYTQGTTFDGDWGANPLSDSGSSGWGESQIDYGSYDDGGYDSYDFAQGGAVPGYDGGGEVDDDPNFVSPDLSPSGGMETDDIDANLNAGEFVIPQDIVMWKGQEFFQKLIEKSRMAREGAPAKPSMSMG